MILLKYQHENRILDLRF